MRKAVKFYVAAAALIGTASAATAVPYYSISYTADEQLAPGVISRKGTITSPSHQFFVVFEIDMTNKNVELMPVFKAAGNVAASSNETPSSMGQRTNAIAAVNAGYYDTANFMTNSYTEIDGVFIGGASTNLRPEGSRSVIGFSGDHQAIAVRAKLSTTFVATPSANWTKVVDAIAGRGYFTWDGTNYTVDTEATGAGHYDTLNPRTVIGYKSSPYTAYLVAIDGRNTGVADGMTYDQLAQLMADIGAEKSVSLDGGGSTVAWTDAHGILDNPSDGSERAVASSWVVVQANTMDNAVAEVTTTGTWTTDTASAERYSINQLLNSAADGAATVTWTPTLGQSGQYRVFGWWTSDPGRATAAPYSIVHADGVDTVSADQTRNGGAWQVLGTYNFNAGSAGSVTLTNSAPGSVSADAIRFVRIGNVYTPADPGFVVTGTLYQTGFETNPSSDFTVTQINAADNSINFQYDYSTFAQQAGRAPKFIPQSPSSSGAGTKALRMGTNITAGTVNGLTATLTAISGQSNLLITFDAWHNYNGGFSGGSGSTEFASFGASGNASKVATIGSSYASATSGFSGFHFDIACDGGASDDYRYYDGNGSTTNVSNGARAKFLGSGVTNHTSFMKVFNPINIYETPGTPGKAWNRWEVAVLNGKVRLKVTKPDGHEVVLCDWFTPNANATLSNLLPHFGLSDPNSSSGADPSDNFVLYDNIKVQSISSTTDVGDWMMYETASGGL
ncbi:hypothetical protein BH09SUM1_BH09SUM1_03680 [soil metagenome]